MAGNTWPNVGQVINFAFVDADEEIRVPVPYPAYPTTKQEWRERQRYYLLDQ